MQCNCQQIAIHACAVVNHFFDSNVSWHTYCFISWSIPKICRCLCNHYRYLKRNISAITLSKLQWHVFKTLCSKSFKLKVALLARIIVCCAYSSCGSWCFSLLRRSDGDSKVIWCQSLLQCMYCVCVLQYIVVSTCCNGLRLSATQLCCFWVQ